MHNFIFNVNLKIQIFLWSKISQKLEIRNCSRANWGRMQNWIQGWTRFQKGPSGLPETVGLESVLGQIILISYQFQNLSYGTEIEIDGPSPRIQKNWILDRYGLRDSPNGLNHQRFYDRAAVRQPHYCLTPFHFFPINFFLIQFNLSSNSQLSTFKSQFSNTLNSLS